MNISEIRRTMLDKGIPMEVINRFIFPATEQETPEEKVAFAAQMDHLLSKDQILSIMEEQGCSKEEHPEIWLKLSGKPIEERIQILNAMGKNEYARSRLNDDGTLSIFWDHEKNGSYVCVCSTINELSEPVPVSLTYCGCCSGHVKYHFEYSLGVRLRLLEIVSSPLSSNGERYCEHLFEILKTEGDDDGSVRETARKIGEETMRFMRGQYALDEIGNGEDEIAFYDGTQPVLTISIRDGYYDFHVNDQTVRVYDRETLEKAKVMIKAYKEPNRRPFPREQAIYGDCGHRCDLCVHYDGDTISEEFRKELKKRIIRVYSPEKSMEEYDESHFYCPGCKKAHSGDPAVEINDPAKDPCDQKKCAAEKGIGRCLDCPEYDCGRATVGYRRGIEPRSISADDVTWAILPYVDGQYGN